MKKKSVGINAVLNVIKQLCAILFPLITFPYVSRVLQAENYGKINFSNSVITYFTLIAALGINQYAVREGARIRDNKAKFQTFSEQVFTINVITTVISYALLLLLTIFWGKLHAYWNLLLVQSFTILLTTIGADWVNSVYEDYFYITVRYIVIHILSLALMFIFVKTPDDYVIYTIITVLSGAGANLINIWYIRKYTRLRLTSHPKLKQHIKPMILLFCNALSVQVYVNSDITMLGVFQGDTPVGIYSAAVKIYTMIKQLLNAIVIVTIPRISALLGSGDKKSYNKLLDRTFHSIATLVLPAITGIFMLSYEIIYIIGGEQYAQGYWALRILSLALVGAVFGNFFNNSILVTNRDEKHFFSATLTAAVLNLGLNLILIPWIGYIGAALTTLLAEFVVFGLGLHFSKNLYSFKLNKRDILSCIFGCFLIIIVCMVITPRISNIYARTSTCIGASIIVYAIALLVFKNRLVETAKTIIKRKLIKK